MTNYISLEKKDIISGQHLKVLYSSDHVGKASEHPDRPETIMDPSDNAIMITVTGLS